LQVAVYDYDEGDDHDLIGESHTTFAELSNDKVPSLQFLIP